MAQQWRESVQLTRNGAETGPSSEYKSLVMVFSQFSLVVVSPPPSSPQIHSHPPPSLAQTVFRALCPTPMETIIPPPPWGKFVEVLKNQYAFIPRPRIIMHHVLLLSWPEDVVLALLTQKEEIV